MKTSAWTGAALAACLGLVMGSVWAQAKPDLGKSEYDIRCAVCHGRDGKGQGPYAEYLSKRPSDLTTLSQRNGGVFPFRQTYQAMATAGGLHGPSEMPIWGKVYDQAAADHYFDMPYNPEVYTRARILAVVDYLSQIQAR